MTLAKIVRDSPRIVRIYLRCLIHRQFHLCSSRIIMRIESKTCHLWQQKTLALLARCSHHPPTICLPLFTKDNKSIGAFYVCLSIFFTLCLSICFTLQITHLYYSLLTFTKFQQKLSKASKIPASCCLTLTFLDKCCSVEHKKLYE